MVSLSRWTLSVQTGRSVTKNNIKRKEQPVEANDFANCGIYQTWPAKRRSISLTPCQTTIYLTYKNKFTKVPSTVQGEVDQLRLSTEITNPPLLRFQRRLRHHPECPAELIRVSSSATRGRQFPCNPQGRRCTRVLQTSGVQADQMQE
jgi:hypothetical protein